MKGLRKILRGSWTAKKTNEWVLNKARVKRELLDTVKARIARTILWSHHEETRELPGKRDNARNTRDDMPPPMAVQLAADLHPSADGSAVRTRLSCRQPECL